MLQAVFSHKLRMQGILISREAGKGLMTIVGQWLLAIDMDKQQLLLTAVDAEGMSAAGAQSVVMSSPADVASKGVSPQRDQLKPSQLPLALPVVDNITDALSMAASYSSPAPLQLGRNSTSEQDQHQHSPALPEDEFESFQVSAESQNIAQGHRSSCLYL